MVLNKGTTRLFNHGILVSWTQNKCGFEDKRALEIVNVNGYGNKERKQFRSTYSFYKNILNKLREGSKDYEILCANCNSIKRNNIKMANK